MVVPVVIVMELYTDEKESTIVLAMNSFVSVLVSKVVVKIIGLLLYIYFTILIIFIVGK